MKTKKTPSSGILLLKAGIVFFMLFFLAITALSAISQLVEHNEDSGNLAQKINSCDRYYYAREYGDLREYLLLYELFDEEFDPYWEIVDGYEDYQLYLQFARTEESVVPGSTLLMEQYRQQVLDNAHMCRFEQNQEQLNRFADMIKEKK